MSTRDPPSPADGPARDVFATARHGQHCRRKHTWPLSRPSHLLPLSLGQERDQTHKKMCKEKKYGLESIFKPLTRKTSPTGERTPESRLPRSVQA